MKTIGFVLLVFASIFPFMGGKALAFDGYSFSYGGGNSGAQMIRLGIQQNWDKKWFADSGSWRIRGYWDAELGYWEGKHQLTDISFTPVFRFESSAPATLSPYIEGGIGVHLLSRTSLDDSRKFSTAFQFGDHVGAGVRFGSEKRYDIGVRLQHLSNGSIKKPNCGMNFGIIRFQYFY